jgi:hypothetical protein
MTNFFFLSDNCGNLDAGHPLWQLLLCLARAVTLRSKSHRTHYLILLSFETTPTWKAKSPYLCHPGSGWPSYTSRHWVPFSSPLRLAGLRWTLCGRAKCLMIIMGLEPKNSKFKLYYNWRSVGQSVLVSGTHLGPMTKFSPFFDAVHPPWRGQVCSFQLLLGLVSCCSGLSPTRLTIIIYCLNVEAPQPAGPGSCIYIPQAWGLPNLAD